MLTALLTFTYCIIAQATTQLAGAEPDLMLKIFVPTASVSTTMYLVWYYTFRQNKKETLGAMKQNQEQFQFALRQNEGQFNKALTQIENQHRENLTEMRGVYDKLFEVIQRDSEYKEVLTGVLTEMKNELIHHTNNHN